MGTSSRRRLFQLLQQPFHPLIIPLSPQILAPLPTRLFHGQISQIQGVLAPLSLALTLASAPLSRRNSTVSQFPPSAAQCRGVLPVLFLSLMEAPASSRILTCRAVPFDAAECIGRLPFSSLALISARCFRMSKFSASVLLQPAATYAGH